MKKEDVVNYSPPRRDSWLARLSEDERLDALSLRRRMCWQDALKYLKDNYGITVSRTSYFATTKRYATNEIAAAQLKAASKPPAIEYLVQILGILKSIDKKIAKMQRGT